MSKSKLESVETKEQRHEKELEALRKEVHELHSSIGLMVEDDGADRKAMKKHVKRLRKLERKLREE